MIDSHTHLDSCEEPNEELVHRAAEAGVHRILTVGMDAASNKTALSAAQRFPAVRAAIGRHPNATEGFTDADIAELRTLAEHPRCAAIGETGLDYFRAGAPKEDQKRAFSAQIALARETGKPLVIHTRDAADDTLSMLREEAGGVEVLLHCFSMPEHLDECADRGWWFSFAGNATYPKNTELAAAVARVPAERLLVETDAPYLSPQPVRKHRNRPDYVTHTARFVAERRGVAYEELDTLLERNAATLFGW